MGRTRLDVKRLVAAVSICVLLATVPVACGGANSSNAPDERTSTDIESHRHEQVRCENRIVWRMGGETVEWADFVAYRYGVYVRSSVAPDAENLESVGKVCLDLQAVNAGSNNAICSGYAGRLRVGSEIWVERTEPSQPDRVIVDLGDEMAQYEIAQQPFEKGRRCSVLHELARGG
jgi:hypothetical protein